ncbi:MAG: NAD-dependent epimerase/dehydratase family protein [Nitrospirae bacterium]|nr:NAD-dependent epimerase/dehydratase family protein [Nitrospirota bacterium]
MRLWITGVSGYIGTRLTQVCDSDRDIESIVGTDIVPPRASSKKLTFIHSDINDTALAEKVRAAAPDTAIHLAFILNPIHDVRRMARVNIDGTRNFLQAVEALNIKRILVASSATAYGAHPDNPVPLNEEHPVRGDSNRNYPYSEHKAIIDRLCQEFSSKHPGIQVVIVRPTIVIGPNISNYIGRMISQPRGFTIKGANPPMQYVHEEDVARAFHFLLKKGGSGAYNLTGDGTLTLSEAAVLTGSKTVPFPYGFAYSLVQLFWLLHLKPVESQAGVLNFFRYPWVISNDKIKKLGFRFEHTSRDALVSFLKAQGRLTSSE